MTESKDAAWVQGLRETIELGEGEHLRLEPAQLDANIREERLTIRVSRVEMEAIDREAHALGVGRSTLIRMILRHALGLGRKESATRTERITG